MSSSTFQKIDSEDLSINLHDITLHDLLVNYQLPGTPGMDQSDDTNTSIVTEVDGIISNGTITEDNDQHLIHAVNSSNTTNTTPKVSPADIRSLVSKDNISTATLHRMDHELHNASLTNIDTDEISLWSTVYDNSSCSLSSILEEEVCNTVCDQNSCGSVSSLADEF